MHAPAYVSSPQNTVISSTAREQLSAHSLVGLSIHIEFFLGCGLPENFLSSKLPVPLSMLIPSSKVVYV